MKKEKVKKEKKIKEPKVKNADPKARRKKWKIIISCVAAGLVSIILAGFVLLFSWNDFALTVVLTNNKNRSFYLVETVMNNAFNSRYFDIEVNFECYNSGTNESLLQTQAVLKVIHYDDDTYGYTGTFWNSVQNALLNVYYKNGILYQNVVEHNYKYKQSFATAQASLEMFIVSSLGGAYVFPTHNGVLANKSNFQSSKASFLMNSEPFYIGEKFEFDYDFEREIYKLDLNGNLKERTYINDNTVFTFELNVKYTSINKIFELQYPSDLNTY